jgi:hypothetical protein
LTQEKTMFATPSRRPVYPFTDSPPVKHPLGVAAALAALAIGFNLPYARLAAVFDYPGILREPPEQILQAFAAGGAGLVLTWYAFALAALLFVPVGMAHALSGKRAQTQAPLAIAAAVAGALAGVLQAMGLLRWVMVVPGLAASGDVEGFTLLHAFAGVAVGEHLGQLLTALHVGLIAQMQMAERAPRTVLLGRLTAAAITLGALEGVVLSVGGDGSAFGLMAVAGYLGLTVWMLASARHLLR